VSASFKLSLIFLVASFTVSVLTLSLIQTRMIRRGDWRLFQPRHTIQLYWRELSPLQRWLLYPGLPRFSSRGLQRWQLW
jgi:hypothetical protein